MNPLFVVPGLSLAALAGVVFARAARFAVRPPRVPPAAEIPIGNGEAARRLAHALSFRTESHDEPGWLPGDPFAALHTWLAETFPRVHSGLTKENVGDFGLLFTWQGREEALRPVLLMAHQDVVPVPAETEADWDYPPYAGKIAEGHIWGRGALDNKSSLIGILEAVEGLLLEGFQPRRTVYLAFGHDEEIGGLQGNAKIARLLRSRNVELEFVLDEGGFIAEGVVPGVKSPVALVGVAEKGYLTLELTVAGKGGHSSMPGYPSAIGILSRALVRLEENPLPADLGFCNGFFARIGSAIPYGKRLVLANAWLFGPWIKRMLSRSPPMNASIRTTMAPTMLDAGVKENVLPATALAVVNFRVMPGETTDQVAQRVEKTIADPRIRVRAREMRSESSPVSDIHSASFRMLERTIHQAAREKGLLVAPYLVVGATDSRYYSGLSKNIYRFSPLRIQSGDLDRIHGINERVPVEDYLNLVRFYWQLLRNAQEL